MRQHECKKISTSSLRVAFLFIVRSIVMQEKPENLRKSHISSLCCTENTSNTHALNLKVAILVPRIGMKHKRSTIKKVIDYKYICCKK